MLKAHGILPQAKEQVSRHAVCIHTVYVFVYSVCQAANPSHLGTDRSSRSTVDHHIQDPEPAVMICIYVVQDLYVHGSKDPNTKGT